MVASKPLDASVVHAAVKQLANLDRDVTDAARIDLLNALEHAKSACAAAQARVAADLDRSRQEERAALGVPPERRARGIASEIALARQESPHMGGLHLGMARALVHEMPHTLTLLERGVLSEWRATLLVRETACLTREDRSTIDERLCSDAATLGKLGNRALVARVRQEAARLDVDALVRRASKAEGDRRVTSRPAPDTMAYLTALLSVKQAVAVQAALGRDADAILAQGDPRSRSQIMADLLVERATGISSADGVPVTVNLVISDRALFEQGDDAAYVHGYGPIPAGLARLWAKGAVTDDEVLAELRRVYANPSTGALTAMESKSRCFPKALARLIDTRDRTCRTPWCDAPIRHRDHITAVAEGGPTTADNGAGLCERCNYAKEGEGWNAATTTADEAELHSYEIITPTGHRFRTEAPPLPKPMPLSPFEVYSLPESILLEYVEAA
ncbi:DUF222 domain-containing protein [Skermania sp. ID1734]|nr:DUF222 domain-containing protein [Skermania sp. ID1734]